MEPDTSAGGSGAQSDRAARIAALQASRRGSGKRRRPAHRARVVVGVVSTAAVVGLSGAMALSAASTTAAQSTALASTPVTDSTAATTATTQRATTTTQKAVAATPSFQSNTSSHGS